MRRIDAVMSCRQGLQRICAVLGLLCGLVVRTLAAASAPASIESGPESWAPLNLVETTVAGTSVYYERLLEPNLPCFRRELTKFVEGRSRLGGVLAKRSEIIAEINQLLGETHPNLGVQEEVFAEVIGMLSQIDLTFRLVTQRTIKEFLRAGGQLPDFTYDPESDTVEYSPRLHASTEDEVPAAWEFCIPVPPDVPLEACVSGIMAALGSFLRGGSPHIAIHEVTELTLLRRVRPSDPYWRWFSDGFANAITGRLIARHLGEAAAREFAGAYDPNECKDLQRQINLRYWMLGNYSAYVSRSPVGAERRIQHARYTYAMLEAQRLIDAHGIDCVRRILDAVSTRQSRKGADLLEVIRDVTGEDMDERLSRYQDFQTRAEGMIQYADARLGATQEKDLEAMFVNGLRLMELDNDVGSPQYLRHFMNAARLLAMMGHEEAGDAAIQQAIDLYSKDQTGGGRRAAMEMFVAYALDRNKPHKALAAAEELLAVDPQNVPALSVKMLVSLHDRKLPEARAYALQIQSLAEEQSVPYRVASQVLAMDPNEPAGPAEPK
jgi:hypothetical protein